MEKYGDLITNGLDLISFLLVTPEILRVITPAVAFLMKIVAFTLAFFAATVSVVATFIATYPWMIEWKLPNWFIWVTLVSALIPIEASILLVGLMHEHVSKHLFALGVVLFLISRLIAFYGSAVKACFL